eukprot:TRINITY_DN2699_c0_g1_i1.p1 TRINITY_DN2699_c0_g1~~TRINITY_DN2699_c0_g1_i1.p1  ORF type:complete len:297 (+),score=82.21 TRINITY_DN2699_c0_g1_i1:62-892(+)
MAFRHTLLAAAILVEITICRTVVPLGFADEDPSSEDFLSHEKLLTAHSQADANKDGKVSIQELMELCRKTRALAAAKEMETLFEEKDSNQDGKISFDEMHDPEVATDDEVRKHMEATNANEKAKFEAADLDRDGVVSREEATGLFFPEQNEKVLEVLAKQTLEVKDMDNDGFLSQMEVVERDVSHEDSTLQEMHEEEKQEFKSLDTDGDGKLNLQEVMRWESGVHYSKAAMENLIATADKNSDGHITADELTGARESLSGTDAGYSLLEWAEHHEL